VLTAKPAKAVQSRGKKKVKKKTKPHTHCQATCSQTANNEAMNNRSHVTAILSSYYRVGIYVAATLQTTVSSVNPLIRLQTQK